MSTAARPVRTLGPLFPLAAAVVVMDLIGAPIGLWLDTSGAFEALTPTVDRPTVIRAYLWTLYAVGALALLYVGFGTRRRLLEYQAMPVVELPIALATRAWAVLFTAVLACLAVFFVQADFEIPLLSAAGSDYLVYAVLRTETRMAVNQMLFNVALYLLATPLVILSWTTLRRAGLQYRLLSLLALAGVGSFTLARSPLALAGVIMLNYALLLRPRRAQVLLPGLVLFAVVLLLNHMVAQGPVGYGSVVGYLGARVVYGEWAAVPAFFAIFDGNPAPIMSVLPVPLQELFGTPMDSPARIALKHIAPAAVEQGRGGVANGFFIGDAFAVGGIAGVIASPIVVAAQLWLVVYCFRMVPKTQLSVLLFSWFLFKLTMGILGGFSAFLISSLQIVMLLFLYFVLLRLTLRVPAFHQPIPAA